MQGFLPIRQVFSVSMQKFLHFCEKKDLKFCKYIYITLSNALLFLTRKLKRCHTLKNVIFSNLSS